MMFMTKLIRKNSGKLLAIVLTMTMIMTSVSVCFGALAIDSAPLPANGSLSNGTIYNVTDDKTIEGSSNTNGLSVDANATAYINIASGVTLTVKGGNANNTTAGKAGILLGNYSKLVFIGDGILVVKGGNGSSGVNGTNNSGTTAGKGGAGGAGGGAGIGTDGGKGGTANGGTGSKGTDWPANASVTIANTVNCPVGNRTDGTDGSAGNNGTQSGSNAGGYGGGGGKGCGGCAIGTGGGGGNGGTNGTNGSSGSGCSGGSTGSNGSKGDNGQAGTAEDPTISTALGDLQTAVNANAELLAADRDSQIALGHAAIAPVYQDLSEKKDAADSAFGNAIVGYLFPSLEDQMERLEVSVIIAEYIPIIEDLGARISADISDYTKAQLQELYAEFETNYNAYLDINNDAVYNYFEVETGIVDREAVEARGNEILNAMEIAVLREDVKPQVFDALNECLVYNQDWVVATDNADVPLSASRAKLSAFLTSLNNDYKAENVALVFNEGDVFETLQEAIDAIDGLMTDNEYKNRFSEYVSVYRTAFEPVSLDASEDDLYAVLNAKDAWVTQLEAFVDELEEYDAALAAKIEGELLDQMTTKINDVYGALKTKVEAKINVSYDLYMGFVEQYGYTIDTSDDVCVENYSSLQTSFAHLDTRHYDFIVATDHVEISEEAVSKYNAIKNAVFAFKNFNASKGLSAYEYNKDEVTDIVRLVTSADVIRDEDFTVDAEKREAVYAKVKDLLNSDLLKELLGDSFDLSTLGDTLSEAIFSNDLVNTLVSFIYPYLVEYFAKTWAGLPSSQPITDPVSTTVNLTYEKIENVFTMLGFQALPYQLAAKSELNAYPEIKAALQQVTTKPVYTFTDQANDIGSLTTDPWADERLLNDEGKLDFDWGVHDKESFVNALSAALSGVEPLILALLSNKEYKKENVDIADGTARYIVSITVNPINLTMRFTANDGFDNALAPILSVLGAENIGNGESMNTVRKVAQGLADPLEEIINKLKADPLDFILNALPNLAYALKYGLVGNVLNNMRISINYWADASYTALICNGTASDVLDSKDTYIPVDIGDMLLGGLGLDFSSASGLINGIIGMLGGDEETDDAEPVDPNADDDEEESSFDIAALLSALDVDTLFNKISLAGDSVTWKTGYRSISPFSVEGHTSDMPYINSNPADLFMWLVQYLIDEIGADEDLLPSLIAAISGDDEAVLPEIVQTIIDNITNNPDDSIAAITELMLPVDYSDQFKEYTWRESTFTYNVPALEASDVAYLKYANNWTEDKADAIVEGAGDIVDSVMSALGKEGTLSDVLGGLIGGALNNETINSLKTTLAGLGETLGEDTAALLSNVLGIDLGAFADIEIPAFEDGDVVGFFSALKALLEPFSPVFAILFGQDFTALEGIIDIKGYDTYPKAIKQLFDALGIDQIDEETEPEDALGAILDAIGAKVDSLLSGNVVKNILGLVPNLVYYIDSNALGVGIFNLLLPIQVVIDTIRPIYDIDIMELIGSLGSSEDSEEPSGIGAVLGQIDFDNFTMASIIGIVDEQFGTNLTESTLMTYAVPALYADKVGDKVGDFTSSVSEADTLTILLSGLIEALQTETASGKTNGEILFNEIGGEDAVATYEKIFAIFTAQETTVENINWDYMYNDGEIRLDSFALPEYTESGIINYLSYNNAWNEDLANYLDDNLETIVSDVLEATGNDAGFLTELLSGLINDNLYTDDLANKLIEAIGGLLSGLDSQLISVADILLDTDLQNASFEPVSGITDSASFIDKVASALAPADRLLAFVLFGEGYRFFYGNDGEDLLVLNGGEAYDSALVPVLEALGVDMPSKEEFLNDDESYNADAALRAVLTAVAARLDEIAADPINEILALLPNVIYFINADGVKAVVNNTLAPFDALVRLVTGNEEGSLLGDIYGVPSDDLTTANIMTIIENAAGIEFTDGEKQFLPMFYIGGAEKIDSANGLPAFKMVYPDESSARRDMITILAAFLIETVKYKDNVTIFKDILPENAYEAISNMLSIKNVDMKKINWLHTEAANTDTVFSGITTSELFDGGYGPLFTQEMATYIANHLDEFIDDLIQLLGIQIDGEFVTSLDSLLEGFVGETIYTTANAEAVLGYIKQAVEKIDSLPASNHIKAAIKLALNVDLDYYDSFEITAFEDGDRDAFLQALCDSVKPLYRLLTWLLCDDTIAFFTDSQGEDEIILPGAEGYRFGIGPILEALDCENIPSQDELNAAEDSETIIKMIANPLFDRIDAILENPVDEVFEILPNVAYFINSNGLDTSVKNLLNAVYTLLGALEPILPESFDLDAVFANLFGGRALDTIDMQYLLDMIVDKIAEGTDEELQKVIFDAAAEMTTGKIVSYDSMTGFEAYKMVYAGDTTKADTVTIVLRFALNWIATGDNPEKLKTIIREKVDLPEDGYKYMDSLIDIVAKYCTTPEGMDTILHAIAYIFYGLYNGTDTTADWLTSYNAKVKLVKKSLGSSRETALVGVAKLLDMLYTNLVDPDGTTGNVYSSDGLASNGFISLFQQIIEWFRTIFAKIKVLFGG